LGELSPAIPAMAGNQLANRMRITMTKLSKAILFETAFNQYSVDELLGEGGAGRVYGGKSSDGNLVAVKALTSDRATLDKKRRFKNETAFLMRNQHPNIVAVLDYGLCAIDNKSTSFYVMKHFDCSLRSVTLEPENIMPIFSQILDGVEAAHLNGVFHRDLKPENILFDKKTRVAAIADFGVASFAADQIATLVETGPNQRLANFQYAAPEQRKVGAAVNHTADIYALGLILNEMYTGTVPHGTNFSSIESKANNFAFLDPIVEKMISQSPTSRPQSIGEVKSLIQRYAAEAVTLQRLNQINGTVVKIGEITDSLALEPPRLIGFDFQDNNLKLVLDRPPSSRWVEALLNMGSYSYSQSAQPHAFTFRGTEVSLNNKIQPAYVQGIIDDFKTWLPKATAVLKHNLERDAQLQERLRKEELERSRISEEERLSVLRTVRI
jgi:serine/threonine protein kinase